MSQIAERARSVEGREWGRHMRARGITLNVEQATKELS